MVRWEPDARERLQAAALELYASSGFEETKVADIARSVGLTERTFFRHFADKREVIFAGQDLFQRSFTEGIAAAADGTTPLDIVASAIVSAAVFFPAERRSHSRLRQTVIVANPELQERELLKLAALATSLAAALRDRGIGEPTATLAAESGVTVFRVAFELWIADGEERPLVQIERDVLAELRTL